MKLYLVNTDNIYFSQTKEYFREIISSYDNGNYRSAMVMLYSTIVCDLILKLKELSDVYSDEKAEKILEELEKKRKTANSSQWEWDLINKIKNQTEILSDETYATIEHIYSLRNFSAHPALTEDYELISPSPEMTVAYIKKALENIFTKPAVFTKNIVDRMSNDIASKKDLYRYDLDAFSAYLNKVYLSRMSDKVIKKVFYAFWKFTFKKAEGEEFVDNRHVNRNTLEIILDKNYKMLCEYISENKDLFTVASDYQCEISICILLACYPEIFFVLDSTVQYQIKTFKSEYGNLLRWFTATSLEEHLNTVNFSKDQIGSGVQKLLKRVCSAQGAPHLFTKFLISHYGKSASFNSAKARFEDAIEPWIDHFSESDFVELINIINNNYQIYNCFGQTTRNDKILQVALPLLPETFDLSQFEHFEYTPIKESENIPSFDDIDDGDGELPF